MLDTYVANYMRVVRVIDLVLTFQHSPPDAAEGDAGVVSGARHFEPMMRETLGKFPVPLAMKTLDGIGLILAQKNAGLLADTLRKDLEDLRKRVVDYAESIKFLYVPPEKEVFYPGLAFDQSVFDKFPETIEEASEAGKCYALGRYTACVFHLMRAMEASVAVLAAKLAVTVRDQYDQVLPWGKLVANIKPAIDKMQKGAEQDEWLQVHALLHSVNRAFRTPTAHPKKTYTDEEAVTSITAVRSYLAQMATLA